MKQLLRDLRWILPASLLPGGLLVLTDPGGSWWIGWLAFSLILFLGLTALSALWRWAGASRTLAWALAIALILRLALGVTAYLVLPWAGYGNDSEKAGYIFFDSFRRDTQSWELAQSEQPLWSAFDKSYSTDQYGGLLWVSSFSYRYLSPDMHRPLVVTLLAAFTVAAGIALAWKAVASLWGRRAAVIVAWILALYPETLLQGSAQQREPFLMTFLAMTFWGLVDWFFEDNRRAWPWIAGGILGMLFFSPGVAVFAVIILGGWAWLYKGKRRISWRSILLVAGVLVLGLILLWLGLSVGPLAGRSPLEVFTRWLQLSSQYEAYQAEVNSGMVQFIFADLPKPMQLPFLTVYGMTQPVLPATLFEPARAFWKIVNILRAAGWYSFIPVLVFSIIPAWKCARKSERQAWLWLWLAVWAWIVISSLRAGGDQWDNPRYRGIMLLPQALLFAQGWLFWRDTRTPWFARIIAVEAIFVLFFAEWYFARYIGPIDYQLPFGLMIGLIVLCSGGVFVAGWLWDWSRARKLRNRQ